MSKEIHGVLHAYSETGTGGTCWALFEDGGVGYDGLYLLNEGDGLMIYDNSGAVLFDDCIRKNSEACKIGRPFNPLFKQQTDPGSRVLWTQFGWTPDAWARFFVNDDTRARLVKK